MNARDALPDGGRVTVRSVFLPEDHPRNPARGIVPHPIVLLPVQDTGVGMDEGIRARAFEPSFSTKPAGLGTGLGLSIVYELVRESGGWIGVSSAPGGGTTFEVALRAR